VKIKTTFILEAKKRAYSNSVKILSIE